MFELRLDGHATGLACAMAARLEHLPFAAFKMAHPLEVRASVILDVDADTPTPTATTTESADGQAPRAALALAAARAACAVACDELTADLRTLFEQLPPDPHRKERLWPERQAGECFQVLLRPRQISDEA